MNISIQNKLIECALLNANRYKLSAAVVYKGHMVSIGVNQNKTHPIMNADAYKDEQIFLHAEADAIQKALKILSPQQLSRCDLYIVRVKRSDFQTKWITGLAKPCAGCSQLIRKFNIKNVYYSVEKEVDSNDICVNIKYS